MSSARRTGGPAEIAPYIAVAALGVVFTGVAVVWVACALAHAIAATPPPPRNPFTLVVSLAAGKRSWPGTAATLIVVAELVVLAAAGTLLARSTTRWRGSRTGVDAAARHLASRRDLARLGPRGAAETAERLGTDTANPGIVVGRVIGTGQLLYGSWEDMHCDIWGPRTGKTTARAIPAILQAPGLVLVTSNKRDIVDATRAIRDEHGPVWVFDPQDLLHEGAPTWWWNPLGYVTDVDHATRLAALWAEYSRPPGSRPDAYFDPEGEALLAFMLLAAAVAGRPVTKVYSWLTDQTDTQPADLLRAAGHELAADGVDGVINLPEKQRGGIYGTAKKSVAFLVNPKITRWVTPAPGKPEFIPARFVAAGEGTLYSMSQEGRAVAGPLVAAQNIAVIEAAEEQAARSPGGRLKTPFLGVLDEAANTCRWRDLPDLYSHYGSRGIVLMTLLQSWAQGALVWGDAGMDKLWSSANIRVYGGGVTNTHFLGDLSTLVGDYDPTTTSVSVQRGQGRSRSTTTSTRLEKILDAADLAAMPRGRALVIPSGSRPVLIETLPWQHGPHAKAVRESLAAYAPAEELTHHELDPPAGPGA